MDLSERQKNGQPAQHQERQPGFETDMDPRPVFEDTEYTGSGRLKGKTALITGGDSGIGRAAAISYAKEGADLAIIYLNEDQDASTVKQRIEEIGTRCLLIAGDVGEESFCKEAVEKTVAEFGKLDILVNNAAEQHPVHGLENISADQLEKTFRTNVFSMFHMTKAALNHLKKGASIINTASVTAYQGNPVLIDYSSTKGAIVSFTRAMANSLAEKNIRVNAVAPGPIWTPLIPATFPGNEVEKFGTNTPLGRPGQPVELASTYVLLASDESSYTTGQVMHINGGSYTSS